MSEVVDILIGNHIGKFVKYDEQNNYASWRKFMRIRVGINVQLPLKKSWFFNRMTGDKVQVVFKYEKLGTFCFLCGLIGHLNFCHLKFISSTRPDEKGWGNFVRAESGAFKANGNSNKWLRNGRNKEGGGSGVGEGRFVGDRETDGNDTNTNVINERHTLHGKVLIDRDSISKKLVFFKAAERSVDQAAKWISFNPVEKLQPETNEVLESSSTQIIPSAELELAVSLTNKVVVSPRVPTGSHVEAEQSLASQLLHMSNGSNIPDAVELLLLKYGGDIHYATFVGQNDGVFINPKDLGQIMQEREYVSGTVINKLASVAGSSLKDSQHTVGTSPVKDKLQSTGSRIEAMHNNPADNLK
ncbi:unnamed protein product [Vicia faba]|uniref:Zinc knuckle CX2CX4HX4C domain-containing protein n=1 Tax=Vicia faba TaxID=3906 RepID=A0AAV1BB24_VICFA|nr:unnamed protein product [Vicia faba]